MENRYASDAVLGMRLHDELSARLYALPDGTQM